MITALDHIQIALPAGQEAPMRSFYCHLLGMTEVEKPEALSGRGGFWAEGPGMQFHFGVDPQFRPQTKAHPAFTVGNFDRMLQRLEAAGRPVIPDERLPGVRRIFTTDPVGNRVELIAEQAETGAS